MKKLFLLLLLSIVLTTSAQDNPKVYYIYSELHIYSNSILSNSCYGELDNGRGEEKIKDENNKTLKFKSESALLLYLQLQGWDIYARETTNSGDWKEGKGELSTKHHWLLKKSCTQQEAEEIVKENMIN